MKLDKKDYCKRISLYLLGLAILAAGLTLNTKVTLGVSPILSVSFSISQLWPLNFSAVTFVWYCLLVTVELAVHLRMHDRVGMVSDLLQLPVTMVFTLILNLYSSLVPVWEELDGFYGSLVWRVLMLLLGITLTGIGAATTLRARLVPNPGDGIVQTLADFTGKKLGTVKNFFDLFCASTAAILSLVFAGHLIGVGPGTVAAVLLTGRVITIYNRIFRL